MKNWTKVLTNVLILGLMASCASLKSSETLSLSTPGKTENKEISQTVPKIPIEIEEAFLPFRMREDGLILPSYQWRECVKKFVICVKWKKQTVFFEDFGFFLDGDYGVTKRPKP